MNACPYCGESLADGAVQCSRCAMMLDGGDGEPPDEFDAPAGKGAKGGGGGKNAALREASARAAAAHKEPPPKKTQPCPKCDRPVNVTAHRCPSCGTKIRDVISESTREEEAKFQRMIRLGAAGIVVAILLVLGLVALFGGSNRPKNIEYAKMKFEELATMVGPTAKGTAQRQKDNWLKLGGKWVRWEGRVMDIEKGGTFGDAALLLRHRDGKGDADVRITLPQAEIEKPGVHIGAKVAYTGRLKSYQGTPEPFLLSDGQVVSAKE